MDNNGFTRLGISQEIGKALQNLGYETPTEVQAQVIPAVIAGKDVIVRSQTGSGKTAAFAIPVCEKIVLEQRFPQALVLTPTRELALQVKQDIANIGRFKKIRCAVIFGGQPMAIQQRELKQRVHVIAGTPGRTLDHIDRENIQLEELKYLIIDEADKMLAMGFIDQVAAIVQLLPRNRVTMLFSATLPEEIQTICKQYMRDPLRIDIESKNPAAEKIQQIYYEVQEIDKFDLMQKIIYTQRPDSCIIFCSTREQVETLFKKTKQAGHLCGSLHGGMLQRERLKTIQGFKRGAFHFLIATDVAARGIHVEKVSLIINYDLPLDAESYVHRIGRTGRAGNEGIAITFVTLNERKSLADIEGYIHYQIPRQEPPSSEEAAIGKQILKNNNVLPKFKSDHSEKLNKEITKIRINAGRKTKMRPGDILGAISNIDGVNAADIGIIDVQETCSYVEILSGQGSRVIEALSRTKIKGKVYMIKEVGFRGM